MRSQGGSSSGFGSGGGSSGSSGSLFGGGNDAQGLDGLCIGQRLERLERRLLLLLSSKPRRRGQEGSKSKNGGKQAGLTGRR